MDRYSGYGTFEQRPGVYDYLSPRGASPRPTYTPPHLSALEPRQSSPGLPGQGPLDRLAAATRGIPHLGGAASALSSIGNIAHEYLHPLQGRFGAQSQYQPLDASITQVGQDLGNVQVGATPQAQTAGSYLPSANALTGGPDLAPFAELGPTPLAAAMDESLVAPSPLLKAAQKDPGAPARQAAGVQFLGRTRDEKPVAVPSGTRGGTDAQVGEDNAAPKPQDEEVPMDFLGGLDQVLGTAANVGLSPIRGTFNVLDKNLIAPIQRMTGHPNALRELDIMMAQEKKGSSELEQSAALEARLRHLEATDPEKYRLYEDSLTNRQAARKRESNADTEKASGQLDQESMNGFPRLTELLFTTRNQELRNNWAKMEAKTRDRREKSALLDSLMGAAKENLGIRGATAKVEIDEIRADTEGALRNAQIGAQTASGRSSNASAALTEDKLENPARHMSGTYDQGAAAGGLKPAKVADIQQNFMKDVVRERARLEDLKLSALTGQAEGKTDEWKGHAAGITPDWETTLTAKIPGTTVAGYEFGGGTRLDAKSINAMIDQQMQNYTIQKAKEYAGIVRGAGGSLGQLPATDSFDEMDDATLAGVLKGEARDDPDHPAWRSYYKRKGQ